MSRPRLLEMVEVSEVFYYVEYAVANGDGRGGADILAQDIRLFGADRQAALSAGMQKRVEFLEGSLSVCAFKAASSANSISRMRTLRIFIFAQRRTRLSRLPLYLVCM
ncbi:hypothetical protein PoB_006840200 [Plakobranchus ocellatus]|uniref:Uncharacterized protein n=1 Tax=Plakobranchus ocellatus TaxID=259542 RepID=A0AAV4DCC0_9GAST|nr:hypothetical protein PoB_006840200 [Plakobranchus ocellatus]